MIVMTNGGIVKHDRQAQLNEASVAVFQKSAIEAALGLRDGGGDE
jgi:hypothetical protein